MWSFVALYYLLAHNNSSSEALQTIRSWVNLNVHSSIDWAIKLIYDNKTESF